ncbi:EI24 domain-containing protein [Erythrobacter tepidarius]|uniref:EI24 domain-containing protein n=1 Tax=Erythrobacter tepidarius TaxID=60454 RepID=UPI000A35FA7E|nr:EI24 domain-containing protein [Erythrobacter tepidarius]
MTAVAAALAKALGQLGDRRILAVVVRSVALTLAAFGVAGAGLYCALAAAGARYGIDQSWAGIAAIVLVPVAMWLLFRMVAMAVLQFFADAVVAAVEARHYPARAAEAKPLPFRRDLANSVRGLLRALGYNLLALPLAAVVAPTAFGPGLVFLGVNAVLLGRELTDMAWLRHAPRAPGANPVGKGQRFVLGACIAGLMLVPVAGLIAPVLGAAAGTHLVLRRLEEGKAEA